MIDKFDSLCDWQEVKDACMVTVNKLHGKMPDSEWKKRILKSEHSPIRQLMFRWRWIGIPYWVSVHFVRHKYGIEHWVSTQRTDRTGEDRGVKPQNSPVNHECLADAQSLINISRRRLCNQASAETRNAWKEVIEKVREVEPEIADCCVRECVYRGFCPEFYSCGYVNTDAYKEELERYQRK